MNELSVIFVTGYSHESIPAQDIGCDGFIQKPFNFGAFMEIFFGYGGRDQIHLSALRDALFEVISA